MGEGPAAAAALGDLREELEAHAGRLPAGRAALWYGREAGSLAWAFGRERCRAAFRRRDSFTVHRRRGDSSMRIFLDDLWFAARALWRRPAFAGLVVATLALGIGGNVAVFSVVDGVLLRPLPYADPERIVMVWENDRLRGTDQEATSGPDFHDFVEMNRSFEALAARTGLNRTLGALAEPVRVSSARVSEHYFSLLGVRPIVGRGFLPEEFQVGGDRVVLLTEALWRARFGADPRVVGQQMLLDGEPRTLVGVVPAAARLPGLRDELFEPLAFGPGRAVPWPPRSGGDRAAQAGGHGPLGTGRLERGDAAPREALPRRQPRPGRTRPVAAGRSDAGLTPRAVAAVRGRRVAAADGVRQRRQPDPDSGPRARARARDPDLARGGSFRLFRQLLTESLLLATGGGILGALLAVWLVRLARAFGPELPRLEQAAVDGRALGFALAASLASALVFGVVPALRAAGRRPQAGLAEGGRASATVGSLRTRKALAAFELVAAVVLLAGAGLLVRSFWKLQQVDPGFDPRGVLLARVSLSGPGYVFPESWPVHDWPAQSAFTGALAARLAAAPGVRAVAFAHQGPTNRGWTTSVTVDGRPAPAPGAEDEASFRPVSAGYFATLGIPLAKGREFTHVDAAGRPLVAVVNEAFARRHFAGEDPLGQRIVVFRSPREIVGVVPNERFSGLEAGPATAMYLPLAQNPQPALVVIVRSDREPLGMVPTLREARFAAWTRRSPSSRWAALLARSRSRSRSAASPWCCSVASRPWPWRWP